MSWQDIEPAEPDDDPRNDRDDLAKCYAELFATPAGKRVLRDLMLIAAWSAPLPPDVPDALLRHTEGKRWMVAHVLKMLKRSSHE